MASRSVSRIMSPLLRRRFRAVEEPLKLQTKNVLSPAVQRRQKSKNAPEKKRYEGIVEADPSVRGIELMRDPRLNKGMAFTLLERQIMGIHGLLPPTVFAQEEQAERIMECVDHWGDDLDTYIYLTSLQDRNEKLFFKILADNIEKLAPIVYTPTVGRACENFGFIFRKPRGLYITINDLGNVYRVLSNWPERNIKAIVVTDGERILGLGDLGAFGMGIPVGKLSLYTAMGGVPPHQCLPIVLDVGTDNDKLLQQKDYIGLKHKRVRGFQYDRLIDEFMESVERRFGSGVLVQFEDFANHNAFKLLAKYRSKYLTFNDDIQGTASVVVAGLMASMKELKSSLDQQTFLFLGAGEAAIGIANLLTMALVEQGLSQDEARARIWMIDINGLLTKNRKLTPEQEAYGKDKENMTNLVEIVKAVKPTVALGASAAAGAFNEDFIREMTTLNDRPVIFALSNPTSKAECTAEQAYTFSEGKCIFASGSPFGPVTYNGKTFYPGQGNNAYVFPGIALGVIVAGAHHVTDAMFLKASEALAEMVTPQHLAEGRVYPPLKDIREVSTKLATHIVTYAYKQGMAAHYPEPSDHEAFVRSHQYDHTYGSFVPHTYAWPGMPIDGYTKR